MKWEQYKKLNSEDREEWKFKYQAHLTKSIPSPLLFIVFYSLVVMQTFVSATIYMMPQLAQYATQADSILQNTTTLTKLGIWVLATVYLTSIGERIYWKHEEKKWLKTKIPSKEAP